MLLVPLAPLMRSLLDIDTRERHNTMHMMDRGFQHGAAPADLPRC
jgi:hypothetical protein